MGRLSKLRVVDPVLTNLATGYTNEQYPVRSTTGKDWVYPSGAAKKIGSDSVTGPSNSTMYPLGFGKVSSPQEIKLKNNPKQLNFTIFLGRAPCVGCRKEQVIFGYFLRIEIF